MSIYTRYQEKEYWMHWLNVVMNWKFTDYDDYMNKYGWTTNIEAHSSLLNVAMFFHSVGVLLRRNRIDLTLVEDLMLDGTVRF